MEIVMNTWKKIVRKQVSLVFNEYVLDKQTNTVFGKEKWGHTFILKGVNIDGTFRLKKLDNHFVEITYEDVKNYKSNGKWIERMVKMMTSKRIIHLDFSEKKKAKRKVKVVKKSKKVVDTSEYITITEICNEMGIDPKRGRATLRSKIDKPECGCKWRPQEVEQIKGLL